MDDGWDDFILSFIRDMGFEAGDALFQALPGDGSKRLFRRIRFRGTEDSFVAMANPPASPASRRENVAYLMIGKHLREKGLPVPEIFREDLKNGWFAMEDLGDVSLQDLAADRREDPLPVYERVLDTLFRLQTDGAGDFNPRWCCQTQRYDRHVMRRSEADYFRDAFLGLYLGRKGQWPQLDPAFDHLAKTASLAESRFFLHRDFQSRNIMVRQGRIGIIDWQGGRLGPLGYDLASLLVDPYTDLSAADREALYMHYLHVMKRHHDAWAGPFEKFYPYLAVQRNLQILGAFSYLSKVMKKSYFEAYIPAALRSLHDLLQRVRDPEISALRQLVSEIALPEKPLDRAGPER